MKYDKRLRALEAMMFADPVILYFRDGTMRDIHGPRNFLLDLLVGACGGADLTPAQAEQLDLVCRSTHAEEPGGARMTELIRCFHHGPAQESGNI